MLLFNFSPHYTTRKDVCGTRSSRRPSTRGRTLGRRGKEIEGQTSSSCYSRTLDGRIVEIWSSAGDSTSGDLEKKNWLPGKILHTLAANLTAHPEKMDYRIVSGIVLSRKRLDRRSGHQFNLISRTLILMIRQAGRRQMTLQSSTMTPSKILHLGSHHPVTHLCLLVHLLIRKTKSLHLVPLNLRVKITLLLVSTNFSRLN